MINDEVYMGSSTATKQIYDRKCLQDSECFCS